jgi:hypothetical protein
MTISTGHLMTPNIVTAMWPRPIACPSLSANGPVKTTMAALTTSRITMITVTASRTGMVFHTGRPSPTS